MTPTPNSRLQSRFHRLVLSILWIAVFSAASMAIAQSQTVNLSVNPTFPTTDDSIVFTISGTWNDSCVPDFDRGSVNGFRIDIFLVTPPAGTICTFATTPYSVDVNSNPLNAGTYDVFVFIDGVQRLTDTLTVTQAGGGNGPTITVMPSAPTTTDIVSIKIDGVSNDGCTPQFQDGQVNGFNITINLFESTGPCTQAVTPYSVGPITTGPLAAGTYTIRVFNNGQAFGSPKTFTVTQAQGGCSDLANGIVCLQNDRFELTMTWEVNGNTQPVVFESDGKATALGFFQPAPKDNVVTAKVTNGCSQNGFYWVWLGSFTRAAQLELTVRDLQTGRSKMYRNIKGSLMTTIKDDTFFACSP